MKIAWRNHRLNFYWHGHWKASVWWGGFRIKFRHHVHAWRNYVGGWRHVIDGNAVGRRMED